MVVPRLPWALFFWLAAAVLHVSMAQWGNPWGMNGYGVRPPVNNNNIGIGYPTAYGLIRGDGYQPNNGQEKFTVRCQNGGAHIGQCRIENDAICVALGGQCINNACCTTPFIHLKTSTPAPTTTPRPPAPFIDGEMEPPSKRPRRIKTTTPPPPPTKAKKSSRTSRLPKKTTTTTAPAPIWMTTTPIAPTSSEGIDNSEPVESVEKVREIEEFNKLLEKGRKKGLETEKPVPVDLVTKPSTGPKSSSSSRSKGKTARGNGGRMSRLKPALTTLPPLSIEDEEFESFEYLARSCHGGSKPIGPCTTGGLCPLDHSCQGGVCCADAAFAFRLLTASD